MASGSLESSGEKARGAAAFDTTHWSVVVRAIDAASPDGRRALEQLCRTYWTPLYWFARRRGASSHDAEDLTQAFFADLLERRAIARADPARGRFRTFLLAAFQNFQSNERARAATAKRGGGATIVSLEELRDSEHREREILATTVAPEKLFDQQWAASLIDRALDLVRREYGALGKLAWFEALKDGLWGGRGDLNYAAIALPLGSTEGAVKVAAHRMRQRFKEFLRAEVAQTVLDPAEIEDEMRYLLAAVAM